MPLKLGLVAGQEAQAGRLRCFCSTLTSASPAWPPCRVPYEIAGSSWEAEEEGYVRHLLGLLDRFAPGGLRVPSCVGLPSASPGSGLLCCGREHSAS